MKIPEDAEKPLTKDEAKELLIHAVQTLVIIAGVYALLKAKQAVTLFK